MFASLLYTARDTPKRIWRFYQQFFCWQFQINDTSVLFQPATLYMGDLLSHKLRRFKLDHDDHRGVDYGPLYGTHFHRDGKNLIVISLSEEKLESSRERKESIFIKIYGPAPKEAFERIVAGIESFRSKKLDVPKIYRCRYGWWEKIKELPPRKLEHMFMNEGDLEAILGDIERFEKSKDFYDARGLPYKRGHLYHGQPGTGKSSLILALANHLGRHVCYMDLSTIENDAAAITAFSKIPGNSILVLEDVDIASATHARRQENQDVELPAGTPAPTIKSDVFGYEREVSAAPEAENPKLSLSTILQMMDGVFMRDGTLVIATTNHIDKLDPAFTRPGRFDLKVELKGANEDTVRRMAEAYGVSSANSILLKFGSIIFEQQVHTLNHTLFQFTPWWCWF